MLLGSLIALIAALAIACGTQDPAETPAEFADPSFSISSGTETLGDIADDGITLPAATGIVAAGIGMRGDPGDVQPGVININIPGTPVKAFLYWEGQMEDAVSGDADLTVKLNGGAATAVAGTEIGGEPTKIAPIGDEWTTSFRADITSLVGWTSGANTIEVSDMDFDSRCPDCRNDGASVLVLYDDGSDAGFVGIKDGNDLAWIGFDPPYNVTVAQTFTFPEDSDDERDATLYIITGSVSFPERPNVICVAFDGGAPTEYYDLMGVAGGAGFDDWDTVPIDLKIPAGVTEVTVELKSEQGSGSSWPGGSNPASMVWVTAGLYVEPPIERCEACTPGYWKNHTDAWGHTSFKPTDDFDLTFGVDYFAPDIPLCEAVWARGGGVNALARHAVAALLNWAHWDVNYCYTDKDIFDAVEDMDKDWLARINEKYPCYLGGPNSKCWTYVEPDEPSGTKLGTE
jgi:hypothetical protein